MDHLTLPITLTSITTSLAFLTLVFSPLTGMNGYGMVLAFGICWAWILSLTLLLLIAFADFCGDYCRIFLNNMFFCTLKYAAVLLK